MNQKDMDLDFEAYREERNYRRRQRTKTQRPIGTANKVWEELNAHEEGEIHDRLLTKEVHDFFSDATKIAADIVSKVAEQHEEAVSERLRMEMEEFLRETIRRASEFINVLGDGGELGEEIVDTDMKNLVGRVLDEFRAEGTARVEDKHLGQDPFKTEVQAAETEESQGQEDEDNDDDLGMPTQRIDPSELALAPSVPDADEGDRPSAGFDAKAEGTLDDAAEADPGKQPEKQRERQPEKQREKQPEKRPEKRPAGTSMTEAEKARLREALKTMVRQGLMSKDEARETYRERIGK